MSQPAKKTKPLRMVFPRERRAIERARAEAEAARSAAARGQSASDARDQESAS